MEVDLSLPNKILHRGRNRPTVDYEYILVLNKASDTANDCL